MPDRDSVHQSTITSDPEELWTAIEGVRTRYLRAGSGFPLILLHGLLGYSFSWRFNIPALAKHRTVYAVDMPGAGFSGRSSQLDCSFRGSALRLLQFADALGLGSFDLLGTSHGGAVAMIATATANLEASPRVRQLILVAPVNPWSAHGRDLAPLLRRPVITSVVTWGLQNLKFSYSLILRRLYGDPSRIAPGTLEGYSRPYEEPGSFHYPLQIMCTWNRDLDELERAIPTIDLPVLLVWGSRDTAVSPNSAAVLARYLRNCELRVFPGVGHLPYEEIPNEFNDAVIKFLLRQDTSQ
jgi:pimeloyl-ACP methyl ester carboxylesterase